MSEAFVAEESSAAPASAASSIRPQLLRALPRSEVSVTGAVMVTTTTRCFPFRWYYF